MIDASTFLRRALLADAIFSGVAALGFEVLSASKLLVATDLVRLDLS